jgi:high-affinity Fe2+/Pb2+ permease
MSENKQSTFQARLLLLATLTGAVISIVSAVAYPHSGQEMPVVANIIVATASLAVLPGYILSAYISNNIHDANLILAGVINFLLYSGLTLWLLTWRSRRKSGGWPRSD